MKTPATNPKVFVLLAIAVAVLISWRLSSSKRASDVKQEMSSPPTAVVKNFREKPDAAPANLKQHDGSSGSRESTSKQAPAPPLYSPDGDLGDEAAVDEIYPLCHTLVISPTKRWPELYAVASWTEGPAPRPRDILSGAMQLKQSSTLINQRDQSVVRLTVERYGLTSTEKGLTLVCRGCIEKQAYEGPDRQEWHAQIEAYCAELAKQ